MVSLLFSHILVTVLLIVFTSGDNSTLPDSLSSIYSPLETQGFKKERPWSVFTSRGLLSAVAADFQRGTECRRVVVFRAQGVILYHILSLCDGLEPTMGLMVVDNILYYNNWVMVKYEYEKEYENVDGSHFTVLEKVLLRQQCTKSTFTVLPGRTQVQSKSSPKQVLANQDNDCSNLINFKVPNMMLLSTNSRIGKYMPKPRTSWSSYNPWEELGAVTRPYVYGRWCFRLLVITSYGRSVTGVKVSCGFIQGLLLDSDTLYYGDAVKVKRMAGDVFSFLFNVNMNGTCTKKTISLVKSEGMITPRTVSTQVLKEYDIECGSFIRVANTRRRRADIILADLTKNIASNLLHVYSEDGLVDMSDYTLAFDWNHFNLRMGIGLAVGIYNKTDHIYHRVVAVMAKSGLVALTAVMIDARPAQRLVMREDHLYFDMHIMAKAVSDGETYRVLFRVGEDFCITKEFSVKKVDGNFIKQDLSSEKRSKTDDVECKNLIEGNNLKTTKFAEIGGQTDDVGVPTVLPEDDDSAESNEKNNQAADLDKPSPLLMEGNETQSVDFDKASLLISEEKEMQPEDNLERSGAILSSFASLLYILAGTILSYTII